MSAVRAQTLSTLGYGSDSRIAKSSSLTIMAVEEGWQRRFPFASLSAEQAGELIGEPVLRLQPLGGGLRNSNYCGLRRVRTERTRLRNQRWDWYEEAVRADGQPLGNKVQGARL
jgi:hypothetical protein